MSAKNPTPVEIITFDLGGVVIDYYVFQKTGRELQYTKDEGDVLEKFVVLHALYNSVVLGLCRLADPSRGTWSFRRLADVLEQKRHHTWRLTVDPVINEYYKAIKPLQDETRHKKLAHADLNKYAESVKLQQGVVEPMKMALTTYEAITEQGFEIEFAGINIVEELISWKAL